jgi:hypothetical protein
MVFSFAFHRHAACLSQCSVPSLRSDFGSSLDLLWAPSRCSQMVAKARKTQLNLIVLRRNSSPRSSEVRPYPPRLGIGETALESCGEYGPVTNLTP